MTPSHDVMDDVIRAARDIVDSFTTPSGDFIDDNLTRVEYTVLRDALKRLDEMEARVALSSQSVGHAHVFTALYWHFGPYGRQDVHVHSCFDENCDHVLIGDGRRCSRRAGDHHEEELRTND